MREFLIKKAGIKPSQQVIDKYDSLVSVLFEQMDADNDNEIDLKEFVDAYYHEQRRLEDLIEELDFRIADAETRGK